MCFAFELENSNNARVFDNSEGCQKSELAVGGTVDLTARAMACRLEGGVGFEIKARQRQEAPMFAPKTQIMLEGGSCSK